MKFRPILFSTPMVVSIDNDTKAQTRRAIKPQPTIDWIENTKKFSDNGSMFDKNGKQLFWIANPFSKKESDLEIKPKAKIGDVFWVRETFAEMFDIHEELVGNPKENMGYWYRADGEIKDAPFSIDKWKPSIFMPKKACRTFLEVTNVRVERLQDISEKDAISEGIENICDGIWGWRNYFKKRPATPVTKHTTSECVQPISSFCSLWGSINGKESWQENPFVFVYDFKKVERPEGFLN